MGDPSQDEELATQRAQLELLEAEITALRGKLADSPKRVRALEERRRTA